jgi:ABC-2 type transport system permease protein
MRTPAWRYGLRRTSRTSLSTGRRRTRDGLRSGFGELTGATVLQLLVPLLIVMLSFDALAGERESGTLRQLMSLGVRAGCAGGWQGDRGGGRAATTADSNGDSRERGADAWRRGQEDMVAAIPRMAWMAPELSVLLRRANRCMPGGVSVCAFVALGAAGAAGILDGERVSQVSVWPRTWRRRSAPSPSAFLFSHNIERAIRNGIDGNDPAATRQETARGGSAEEV